MKYAIKCRQCGFEGEAKEVLRPDGVHYSNLLCPVCDTHTGGFGKKPDSDPTKYKRPKAHTELVKKFSRGICEMCLAKKDDLPKGQTLEAHHVIEYQDGGEATRENTWIVCTGCHRLINWRRKYTVIERVAESLTAWMD